MKTSRRLFCGHVYKEDVGGKIHLSYQVWGKIDKSKKCLSRKYKKIFADC